MAARVIEANGRRWRVTLSGRRTQYARDEVSLVFTCLDPPGERRATRFSPQGAKSVDAALAELSERVLGTLLGQSQPAWTSPELEYDR